MIAKRCRWHAAVSCGQRTVFSCTQSDFDLLPWPAGVLHERSGDVCHVFLPLHFRKPEAFDHREGRLKVENGWIAMFSYVKCVASILMVSALDLCPDRFDGAHFSTTTAGATITATTTNNIRSTSRPRISKTLDALFVEMTTRHRLHETILLCGHCAQITAGCEC